jgi:heme exporter protein D
MTAMQYAGFVFGSWGVVAAALAVYAARLVLRGRSLSRSVEPEHRRWMQSSSPAGRSSS